MKSTTYWKPGAAVLSVTLVISILIALDESETDPVAISPVAIKGDQPRGSGASNQLSDEAENEDLLHLSAVQRLLEILPSDHPARRIVQEVADTREIDFKTAYALEATLVENGNRDEVYRLIASNSDVIKAISDELQFDTPFLGGTFYNSILRNLVTRYLQESASDELFENLGEEDESFRLRLYPVAMLYTDDFEKLLEIEDADERKEIEREVVRLNSDTDPLRGIEVFLNPVLSLEYDDQIEGLLLPPERILENYEQIANVIRNSEPTERRDFAIVQILNTVEFLDAKACEEWISEIESEDIRSTFQDERR